MNRRKNLDAYRHRAAQFGRLQHLQRLGLAYEMRPGTWAIHSDDEKTLRALGERGDIIRTMQRVMRGDARRVARAGGVRAR